VAVNVSVGTGVTVRVGVEVRVVVCVGGRVAVGGAGTVRVGVSLGCTGRVVASWIGVAVASGVAWQPDNKKIHKTSCTRYLILVIFSKRGEYVAAVIDCIIHL
jgi:hypothetical protein